MSVVSAFAAVPQDTMQTSSHVAAPGQAATSFAQLLDDSKGNDRKDTQKIPQHRAYSFAELGMFGIHADQFSDVAQDKQNDSKPSAVKILASASPAGGSVAPGEIAASAPLVSVPFLDGELAAAVPAVGEVRAGSATATGNTTAAATPVKAPNVAKIEDERPAPARSAADPAKNAVAQNPKRVADKFSVVVSGPDEALQIALRAPDAATTEVTKLRRLIETTVAHFEMDMAELHFNGTSIDTAFSLGGGADGGSTR